MGRKLQELFQEAASLSESERAELAGLLMHTLDLGRDEDVEKAWQDEIERRIRQLNAGEVQTIPWEQVRAELAARHEDD